MNKYGAKKVNNEYGTFDSQGEYKTWLQLSQLRKAQKPTERVITLERQVIYPLIVNGATITKYIADFRVTYGDGRVEVIDFKNPYFKEGKGKSTPPAQLFNIKCKLMKALYGIEVKVL
jgi:hypothetical protein